MKIRELGDLPKKPLVEAIFEIRWQIRKVADGLHEDPRWRTFLIKFFSEIREEYPEIVELPTTQIPDQLAGYTVQYQYRAGKGQWPLIQIGPGILTVNETAGYKLWEDFRPKIQKALDVLGKVYGNAQSQLQPLRADLRYINAIPFEKQEWSPANFLCQRLHTKVETGPNLFNEIPPEEINLNLTFPTDTPKGSCLLSFATGTRKGEPAIIWQLTVRSNNNDVPSKLELFENWMNNAHATIERCFLTLTEGELLKSFKGETS